MASNLAMASNLLAMASSPLLERNVTFILQQDITVVLESQSVNGLIPPKPAIDAALVKAVAARQTT